jgi:hypothetical protein
MGGSSFTRYAPYVDRLDDLLLRPDKDQGWRTLVRPALDGDAMAELAVRSTIGARRRFGTFFTGSSLRSQLLPQRFRGNSETVFFDPACGMGDLLIAAALRLPLENTVLATLCKWGSQLHGIDLHEQFVRGTRLRIALLARLRHQATAFPKCDLAAVLPNIRVGNGLDERQSYRRATHVLLNPPFSMIEGRSLPESLRMRGDGGVSAATAFVLTALENQGETTVLASILPEVLRTGATYGRWRARVEELASLRRVCSLGHFGDFADVDVFLLRAIRRRGSAKQSVSSWSQHKLSSRTVEDRFAVRVGPVVPHRTKKRGISLPFITARSLAPGSEVRTLLDKRTYKAKAIAAPFVVIRRTSRPNDKVRARASIVSGSHKVLIENHLIVCAPHDGKLSTCRQLLEQLQQSATSKLINQRMRCRHLTVSVVKELPFSRGSD